MKIRRFYENRAYQKAKDNGDLFICWKQPMQTGISGARIQRPLVFLELLDYPTKEVGAAANPMVFPRTLPVGFVDGLSMPC